jgi:hypothetical protein
MVYQKIKEAISINWIAKQTIVFSHPNEVLNPMEQFQLFLDKMLLSDILNY